MNQNLQYSTSTYGGGYSDNVVDEFLMPAPQNNQVIYGQPVENVCVLKKLI
jgi:hypothetical protein